MPLPEDPNNLESDLVPCLLQRQANIIPGQERFTQKFAVKVEDAVLQIRKDEWSMYWKPRIYAETE